VFRHAFLVSALGAGDRPLRLPGRSRDENLGDIEAGEAVARHALFNAVE
jgi:hypothetical protein